MAGSTQTTEVSINGVQASGPRSSLSQQLFKFPTSRLTLRYPQGQFTDSFPETLYLKRYWQAIEAMRRDPVIAGALKIKKWLVVSDGYEVHPFDDTPAAQEQADFIESALTCAQGTVEGLIDQILDGCFVGFSVNEIDWQVRESNNAKWNGTLVPLRYLHINPSYIGFEVGEMGENQVLLTVPGSAIPALTPLPAFKTLLYTYDGRYGSPVGQGDFVKCYRSWWAKNEALGWWATGTEMTAVPTRVGKYKDGASNDLQNALLETLTNTAANQAFIAPQSAEVEFFQPKDTGEQLDLFLGFHNKELTQAILGTVLLMNEGQRVGSMALGKVQLEVSLAQIRRLKREIEEDVIGTQLIQRMIDINWPGSGLKIGGYPRFRLPSPNMEAFADRAAAIVDLIGAGVLNSQEPFIREVMGFPAAPDNMQAEAAEPLPDAENVGDDDQLADVAKKTG